MIGVIEVNCYGRCLVWVVVFRKLVLKLLVTLEWCALCYECFVYLVFFFLISPLLIVLDLPYVFKKLWLRIAWIGLLWIL